MTDPPLSHVEPTVKPTVSVEPIAWGSEFNVVANGVAHGRHTVRPHHGDDYGFIVLHRFTRRTFADEYALDVQHLIDQAFQAGYWRAYRTLLV